MTITRKMIKNFACIKSHIYQTSVGVLKRIYKNMEKEIR